MDGMRAAGAQPQQTSDAAAAAAAGRTRAQVRSSSGGRWGGSGTCIDGADSWRRGGEGAAPLTCAS
jgi:hypothetical protein